MRFTAASLLALTTALTLGAPARAQSDDALLFHASVDHDTTAEVAGGAAMPNFRSDVAIVPNGAIGGAARWGDGGYVAWNAPGNMRAARGTLSFFWRPRTPVGEAPFVIFRTGFADHSSWDMAFLRIDWNGHGFDAFVTDANLSRIRVSWRIDQLPAATDWTHIAFEWDEAVGVRLFVDGREVARKDQKADLDSGLDEFGLAGRVLSPHQVQSRYNFMRGSDVDDIRVYAGMLAPAAIASLAAKQEPGAVGIAATGERERWLHRYGWDHDDPPALTAPVTRIRKVEFTDAKDLKEWMWKGVDGIPETTWPGVYNRSRLPGRDDYFELPDWNTYVEGGKRYDLTVPPGETFNQVEIRGAAYGALTWQGKNEADTLAKRPEGVVRSVTRTAPHTGGVLSFTNVMQEQPIQEIWAYDIGKGVVPAGTFQLDYTIRAAEAPTMAALAPLNAYIAGRYPPRERGTVIAMPTSGVKAAVGAGAAGGDKAVRAADLEPIVHILIPASFGDAPPDQPIARAWDYGWQNVHDGLDGLAIDLPPLAAKADAQGFIPLNIKVKDPIWPGRDMIDVSVSVKPGEARTLWIDLRDRILTHDSLYLTIASAAPDFGPTSIDGARIRMVFTPRSAALTEHVADRFNQVKDNWGFLVEEHTASKRAGLYQRLFGDITDLLRVDPDNKLAQAYWADIDYRPENLPQIAQPTTPAGVPVWAFRQLEDLKYVRRFVDWWIDNRQVPYGDFGGGISDDVDLTQQWPGLALMGVEPDKINASLRALDDAVYKNGMIVNGLGYITTDELHAYEEGLNVNAERLYLNWGEPVTIERLMDNTRGLTRVILKNPAGHLHFSSSWYGGRKIYRDEPWAWQKPYAFTVLHGPTLIGLYNGNPIARGLVTGLADGLLAHGKQDANGIWSYPNEINWDTDQTRAGDGGGATVPLQTMWAAWHFTGDDRYLRPIEARVARAGPGSLAEIDDNVFDLLKQGPDWRKALAAKPGDTAFARYSAWAQTGDTAPLAALHADAIADKAAHEYMYTEGHWWSDRVEQPNEILQRERLGAIALRRNQHWPANAVSWRFDQAGAAEQVAILVEHATPTGFRVVAYNMSDTAQRATMSTWNVTAGTWRLRSGTSDDAGKSLAPGATTRELALERSAATDVTFAPHMTTVIEATLIAPGAPVATRPDLGIGRDDIAIRGRRVTLTVHSLGAKPVAGGIAQLVGSGGRVLATAAIPALAAPVDLLPKTTTVTVTLPAGVAPSTVAVEVALAADAPEVTKRNNRVALVSE